MFEITLSAPVNKEMLIVLAIHTVCYVSGRHQTSQFHGSTRLMVRETE